ncbi:MAG: alpha/beta hydrolase [Flavobacteriaceae bacterium]|nr:alpha/beta hydrolase [Flavobacteriaceae bacterium]
MRDVSYGPHEQQIYDIYLPEGRSGDKTKVIVLVHGGGWIEGDKADMAWYVPLLQLSHPHHAIVNMNYVLATTTTPAFPNQFLDVQQLLQKIYDEREQLQIVPEFGLIGASAGAHLSLMYDAVYDDLDHVKFVADIVGPTDLTDPFYANNPNFQFFLNAAVDESAYPPGTDYASAVSPALHVSGKSSPTILFYGNADPLVPLSNGQTLQNALSTAMVTHSFTIYEGGHGDDWSEADRADLREKLSEFISLHLSVPN